MTAKTEHYGKAGEVIAAYRFLMNRWNVYVPLQTGKRDLVVEESRNRGKYFGVQVKSTSKAALETDRKQNRYRFSFKRSESEIYDQDVVQIFAMVALDKKLVYFVMNRGVVHFNVNEDRFNKQLEHNSFVDTIKRL